VSAGQIDYSSRLKIPYQNIRAEMEYEVQHGGRRCSKTGREFAPGEAFYSVLLAEGKELKRLDYAAEAWPGAPEDAVGWWKSVVPDRSAAKRRWAPNDVMLDFWDRLADEPDKQDMRYVLTLLLVRRRVFRLEEERRGPCGEERLVVGCPRRDATYEVAAAIPTDERIEEIQAELEKLLE
jgi:hypothetical protein